MTAIEFNTRMMNEKSSLKSFALSLTHNYDDALDLLQDTYLKAITYRDKFEESTNLKAWLFTIMKNTFINAYRKNVKTRALIVKGDELALNRAYKQNSYNHSESRLNAKEIIKQIDNLEDDYKLPFTRYYNGYKYEEIANEMHLPLGTVKSRIFIARKILMDALKHFRN
ncbi:RNA polymerase sigma factor [Sediminibacterium sp.]|uniref:RNA polymerase sigma factor n=1 Tax=Sediminibacterium sp. TaxID=1917865 RepID=UPI002717A2BE|nr:RNA polymerase sigma factor [Sediminibacterium sp.]MDO9000312.1 RNA polymerase sigma factor [Bacteroidota bacterium]MDP3147119.1 RNA polymerase sigma factor [Bacteroidota bacterium]MDP3567352.1 RNA polymerase sigma factor [Sediminibacterium sp.]